MGKSSEGKYPCYYAICASMPCGPLAIPEPHCLSEEAAINYVLDLMEKHIIARGVIQWGKDSNKKPTLFWRDKNEKPYAVFN